MHPFWNARTARILFALSVGFVVSAAQAASIRGTVVDSATGSSLPGASIAVEGTDISVTADRSGDFAIDGLNPGHYTLDIDYVGYPGSTLAVDAQDGAAPVQIALENATDVETVTVTGQRQADRIALQTKKVADNIVDALNANDVGKLPDQNVAEAVRRLPGVSVANDQGEGRYVVIRGAPPDLSNVTINGATAPAPEPDGRQVKLDDIPSSLISSVQVIKTLTPDLDANAIAGQVNIDTLSAFDRQGNFLYGRGAYGYYHLNGRNPYEGDITAGGVFGPDDQFGAVLSANYSRRPIESENFGSGGPDWVDHNAFTIPSLQQIRDYNLVRTRSGLVANFDWRPDAVTKLYLRTTYSTFSDVETRDRFTITLPTGNGSYSNQTFEGGDFTGAAGTRYIRSRSEKDRTIDVAAGGSTVLAGGELSFQGGYAHATKRDPMRHEYTFKSGKNISGSYDLTDFLYLVTPSANAYDPANFPFNKEVHTHRLAVEDLYQGRADYLLPLDVFGDTEDSVKFGVKITSRHKTNDATSATLVADGTTMSVADVDYLAKFGTYDNRYEFGPRIAFDEADAYILAAHGTLGCDASTAGGFSCDVETSIADSLLDDYDLKETIVAGYAMATIKTGKLTLIPGVRIEGTSGTYKGKSFTDTSTFDDGFDVVAKKSYIDVFPGVNARYDLDEDLVLRGAVTTSIGRPDYAQLAPFVSVDASEPSVEMGNPDLKPLKSVNVDATVEYYLPHQGIVSVAAFYKHIDDPIYDQTLENVDGTFAGQMLIGASVTQPLNADKAAIRGVELNVQVQFDFLPSPFDGFGVNANYAYIDSEASGLIGRTDSVPLFDQSKNVATIQLLYEKYGIAARLAYSFRSKFLDEVGADPEHDVYQSNFGQLDARLSYEVTDNIVVFAEGANLNDAPWRRYIGVSSHVYENERYGWSMRGGVQFKL